METQKLNKINYLLSLWIFIILTLSWPLHKNLWHSWRIFFTY